MSNEIQNLCWPLKLRPPCKSVLIYLATRADDLGRCWPPIPDIEAATCFKSTAVMKALGELESRGLVRIDRSRRNNTYYLQVSCLRLAKESALRAKREARLSPRRGPSAASRAAAMVRNADPECPPRGNHTDIDFIHTPSTQQAAPKVDLLERFRRLTQNNTAAPPSKQASDEAASVDEDIRKERAAMRGRQFR